MDKLNLTEFENIKCVAVFADRDSASATMKKALNEGRYLIVPAKGRIGGADNIFAVLNISQDAVKRYGAKYRQPFVFADLADDTVAACINDDDCLTIQGDDYNCQIRMSILRECNDRIIRNFWVAESEQYIRFQSLDDCIRFSIERVGMEPMRLRNILYKCEKDFGDQRVDIYVAGQKQPNR